MKNETNFYDIIGSKFNERETPYDDANWKQMRAMIDASRAAKKRAMWLVAASVGLLLCVGGGVAMYMMNNNGGKSNGVANNAPSVNNNTKSPTINTNANQLANSTNSSVQAAANNNVASANSNSNIQNGATVDNNQPSVNSSKVIAITNTPVTLNQKSTKHSRHIAKPASQSIASNSNVALENNMPSNNIQGTKQDNMLNNNTASPNSTTSAPKTTAVVKSPTTAKAPVTASANSKAAVHKMDSAAAGDALPPRFSDEPRVFDGAKGFFSVEAGTEFSGGWQIGSVIQASGFNPMVGVDYARYMGRKIFLKVGLQFLDFGHMSPLTYNYQHSVGNIIYDSVITTQNLYFLRIPVQAELSIGRKQKSSIGIGGAAWFLVGNSGYATTYQQLDNNPPVNMIKYSGNAALNGYSKVDASMQILYRYTINRHFSLCGLAYFELTGMKDNTFFGEGIIERTKGVQFTGAYSF